jgi:probable rRNA maturation factor
MDLRIHTTVEHPEGARWGFVVERLAGRFLRAQRLKAAELSIVLTTDRRIRRLNREWRGHDQATDVLSFPAAQVPRARGQARPLGDIVISLDTARRRARDERHAIEPELARYLAHGLLHLQGYDHREPRQALRMARAESRLLGEAGMVTRSSEGEP